MAHDHERDVGEVDGDDQVGTVEVRLAAREEKGDASLRDVVELGHGLYFTTMKRAVGESFSASRAACENVLPFPRAA